mmetsp:Transcript_38704/g.44198  ORF Transcript_38704/g.44198 Transcript_38704/m.44198 type:complete len:185 (+) Transcript_38704:114-668(+)
MGGPATIGGKEVPSTDNFLPKKIRFPCVIVKDGSECKEEVEWKSVEHLFQAMKFDSTKTETKGHCRNIQEAEDAWNALFLGRSRKHPLREGWEEVKGHAMYLAVKAKYDQNPECSSELVNTTGPILGAPDHWQELNSNVLERVRFELSSESKGEESTEYKNWCQATDLPDGSEPIKVYLSPASA